MKVETMTYEHLFPTGKFENERIGVKVSVDVTENPIEVYKDVKALVLSLHEEGKLLEESKRVAEATEPKPVQKPTEQQFNSPQWTTKTGTRGDYQQIENDKSQEFKILAEYVKSKGGFCNIYGYKTWFHNNNENLVDRKK
jgi:hypothetical protein